MSEDLPCLSELLSSQIEAEAKAEASEIIKAAEEQAKLIRAEAES